MSETEEAEKIAELSGVPLYATKSTVIIKKSPFGRIRWGEFHKFANMYRSPARLHPDNKEVVACGELLELLWGVSNHWLWKNTNDRVMSENTVKRVAENASDYELIDKDESKTVAEAIFSYIESNSEVQDNIIEGRNERLSNSDVEHETIERVDFTEYTGEYELENVLYNKEVRRKLEERIEEYDFEINIEDIEKRVMEKIQKYNGSNVPVMGFDSAYKPNMTFLDSVVLLESDYPRNLSKAVDIAPSTDHLELSVQKNKPEGSIKFQITEI